MTRPEDTCDFCLNPYQNLVKFVRVRDGKHDFYVSYICGNHLLEVLYVARHDPRILYIEAV